MHVLLLPSWYATIDNPHAGGFFRDQALALQRQGVKVGLVFNEVRSLSRLRPGRLKESHFQRTSAVEDGIPVVRRRGWNTLAQTRTGGEVTARLTASLVRAYIREHGRPDVIHAHSILWGGVAAHVVKESLGIPYVVTEHASSLLKKSIPANQFPAVRRAIAGAARVCAVSEALRQAMLDLAPGQPVEVVPNLVDTEFWTLPSTPRRTPPFTLVTAANLVPIKGIDVLIRALATIKDEQPHLRLRIAGKGTERTNLEALVRANGLERQVEFLGSLPREALRDLLGAANAFVLPSRAETFGVVLIEALATGLPVVATRCGGPEEIVTPETGLLVDTEDVAGLAQALIAVQQPHWRAEDLRSYVDGRYSFEAVGRHLVEIYEGVLAEALKGAPA